MKQLTDFTANLFNFQAQLRGFNIKFALWFLVNFPGSNLQEKEKKRQGEKQSPGLLVKKNFSMLMKWNISFKMI